MQKRAFIQTAVAAAALCAASQGFAQQVTLRLHQFLPPQATIPAKALLPWAQKVEKESGGKIKIQLFPAMQLGGTNCLIKLKMASPTSPGRCWATRQAASTRPKCLSCPS